MRILPMTCETEIAAYIDVALRSYLKITGFSESEIDSVSLNLRSGDFNVTATPTAPMEDLVLKVRLDE